MTPVQEEVELTNSRLTQCAICLIVKNERPYLLEWIAYHSNLGFSPIYVYDNDSSDGSSALLNTLHEKRVIQYVPWPDLEEGFSSKNRREGPQTHAYNHCVSNCSAEWICFLDADEFFNLKKDNSIQEFLCRFDDSVGAIAVNWRVFGSSGQQDYNPAPVISKFNLATPEEHGANRNVKSVCRRSDISRMHIHVCSLKRGNYVNADNEPVEVENGGLVRHPSFSVAQINHYVIKSVEEFEWKRGRGDATLVAGDSEKYRKMDSTFFSYHDINEIADLTIHRFRDKVSKLHAAYVSLL